MKFIENYKEFGIETEKSVLDYISEKSIKRKKEVLKYLRSGKDDGIRCSTLFDYITQTLLTPSVKLYTDGEFYWDDEEIYHFEKYNMPLNEEFIKKVLKK